MSQGNPQTQLKVVQHIAAAAHVADVTPSTGVDCKGYDELLVIIDAGTYVGAASVVITLEESSASDGSGDTFASWTGSAFTAITTANDAGVHVGRVKLEGRERYIRATYNYTGNGTSELAPASVDFVLLHPEVVTAALQTYGVNTV